jgi:pyruvate, water dikinase
MKDFIFTLNEANDQKLCGGKALNLSKMIRHGFNVPGGFVLSANCPKVVDEELKDELMTRFDTLNSEFVAVRSSAQSEDGNQAAWAGQLDSFLNCTRNTFIKCLEKCWDSANSDRVISYAEQHGLAPGKVSVIVQSMIQSEVSGVAFSKHPVSNDPAVVVVEAVFGLGEALVSGLVTPDLYVVIKSNLEVLESFISVQDKKLELKGQSGNKWSSIGRIGSQDKLSNAQLLELTKIVIDLEQYFNYPVDVE